MISMLLLCFVGCVVEDTSKGEECLNKLSDTLSEYQNQTTQEGCFLVSEQFINISKTPICSVLSNDQDFDYHGLFITNLQTRERCKQKTCLEKQSGLSHNLDELKNYIRNNSGSVYYSYLKEYDIDWYSEEMDRFCDCSPYLFSCVVNEGSYNYKQISLYKLIEGEREHRKGKQPIYTETVNISYYTEINILPNEVIHLSGVDYELLHISFINETTLFLRAYDPRNHIILNDKILTIEHYKEI